MTIREIAASLYPWDLADEGVDRCLDNLQSRSGVNSTYLVGLMHHEKRPLHQLTYPHNPVRTHYVPEDSRVYWRPDPTVYAGSRLQPLTSERSFLAGTDWLDELIGAARVRGMRTGCEISHTLIDSAVAQERFPDILQRDVFGTPVTASVVASSNVLPCLNNEDVQAFFLALVRDLVDNHDVDFIQTAIVLFGAGNRFPVGTVAWPGMPGTHAQRLLDSATGGCFCTACRSAAEREGLDWTSIVDEVRRLAEIAGRHTVQGAYDLQVLEAARLSETALLLEFPAFAAWHAFRRRSVTRFFELVFSELHSSGREVEFRYNIFGSHPELMGLDYASAFEFVDSVRESDYSEQTGDPAAIPLKEAKLVRARRALADKPLIAALGIRPQATPELVEKGVGAAVSAGCDGLSLGHYDGATMARLDAVSSGLRRFEGLEQEHLPGSATPWESAVDRTVERMSEELSR